jgi:hypothetical protein
MDGDVTPMFWRWWCVVTTHEQRQKEKVWWM